MEATVARALPLDASDRAAALEELVDAYGDGVLQLAYFHLKDRGLAEDLFQEVFTKVYLQWHTFRGDSSPKTWIYRIAINLCRDKLRSWSMRKVLLLGQDFMNSMPPVDAETEEEALALVDKAELLAAVQKLPEEYREVVLLYYYEEMAVREVGEALGLTDGTVRSRLHRARLRLKTILTEGGFTHDRA